jgi:hypothetical protein
MPSNLHEQIVELLRKSPFRADLVVLFGEPKPVFAVVMEAQLHVDDKKLFLWPVYLTVLRSQYECPAVVMVIATDEAVARWVRDHLRQGSGRRGDRPGFARGGGCGSTLSGFLRGAARARFGARPVVHGAARMGVGTSPARASRVLPPHARPTFCCSRSHCD